MNIWLIMSGEPLEMFGERPHRVGILSKMLVQKGHNVTWFTTTFDHQHKKYLYNETTKIKSDFGVNMVFLHSDTPYYKNISFARIKNHKEVGEEFYKVANKLKKPDIILTAFPTIDLAYYAVKYAKENNIPIVVDIRDLWPDIFLDVLPKFLKPFGKILLNDYYKKTKYIMKNTNFIIGVSQKYLDYGFKFNNRKKTKFDKVFPLGFNKMKLNYNIYKKQEEKFKQTGIDKKKIIIWFVGTFGRTYDLMPILKVAKELQNENNLQFVLTGDGENSKKWKKYAENLNNVIFTGWVNKEELEYLGKISKIGVMAYKKGAPQGLPNKLFEYSANGLVILSSLRGETEKILGKEKIGFTYYNDKDLKEKIILLKNNQELLEQMSQNAKRLFDERFSADKVYGDMIEYLENIVKEYKNV